MKSADAEDLVAWRIAELRVQGIDAKMIIRETRLPNGVTLYHPFVGLPDGRVEDPSVGR